MRWSATGVELRDCRNLVHEGSPILGYPRGE